MRGTKCDQAPSSFRPDMHANICPTPFRQRIRRNIRSNRQSRRMPTPRPQAAIAAAFILGAVLATPASAQTCTAPQRKINVGVAVAPPNVVHTAPYIAKALGFFAKRCIDANIIQFDGGLAGTSVTVVAQGTAISTLPDTAIAQGLKAKQIWGLAPRPPQAYVVSADVKTPADLKGRRLSAAGGVGGFNWLVCREVLRLAGFAAEDAQVVF